MIDRRLLAFNGTDRFDVVGVYACDGMPGLGGHAFGGQGEWVVQTLGRGCCEVRPVGGRADTDGSTSGSCVGEGSVVAAGEGCS